MNKKMSTPCTPVPALLGATPAFEHQDAICSVVCISEKLVSIDYQNTNWNHTSHHDS